MTSTHVRIFDTTLRDGEQSPGATMTSAEKLEIAQALARLGVDVIEAGFPAASPDDLAAVRAIATEVGVGTGSARTLHAADHLRRSRARAKKDIEHAWEGVRLAPRPRIHTFLATSDLHMKHKLRHDARGGARARRGDGRATRARFCADVEFSPEDAGRSDPAFLYEVLDVAIRAGATTLNIPDTVGYTTPDEFGALIAGIRAERAGHRRRHHLGALPRRPRPRRRPTRSPASSPARARPRSPSTASASARATPRSRRS